MRKPIIKEKIKMKIDTYEKSYNGTHSLYNLIKLGRNQKLHRCLKNIRKYLIITTIYGLRTLI